MFLKKIFVFMTSVAIRVDSNGKTLWFPFGVLLKSCYFLENKIQINIARLSMFLNYFLIIGVARAMPFKDNFFFGLVIMVVPILAFIFLINYTLVKVMNLKLESTLNKTIREYVEPSRFIIGLAYSSYLFFFLIGCWLLSYGLQSGGFLLGILSVVFSIVGAFCLQKYRARSR